MKISKQKSEKNVYKYTFIEMVYNVLISLLIFPMLYYINEMLENKEARRI